jgi:hypothetical protein
MNLRNYTSSVTVERSVQLIEHCLVQAGADHISKFYDTDTPGRFAAFKLPARWANVYKQMMKGVKRPRPNTESLVKAQAQRTAWKLLYDQVSVLVSNVLIDQLSAVEAFMPYLFDGEKTLYENARDRQFKGLLGPG